MNTQDFKRKLTAVFSADVAGYSRLMGENEAATVRTLEAYKQVMFSLIKQHRGRVVDSPGDNLLAEFASVVDAVQCGVAVHKELQARNAELPENRRMQFRIGINLGDVIEEQDRIYGDGVNIAARLESCANVVFRHLSRSGNRLLYWFIVVQVADIAAMVNLQVFNRYVLDYVLGWEEEVSRYLMIWTSFLVASYALWQGEQLGMEFVIKLLPKRGRRALRIVGNLLCIAFLAVIAYQGFVWMMPQQLDQISPSLGITMAIPYAAIPVSAVMMIWVEALFIWRELRGDETPCEPGTEPLPL